MGTGRKGVRMKWRKLVGIYSADREVRVELCPEEMVWKVSSPDLLEPEHYDDLEQAMVRAKELGGEQK